MLRKALFVLATLTLAGTGLAGDLIDNGSFENGLSEWSQASTAEPGASFESVPNGASHSIGPVCVAPPGFPGSGDFWAVSCQGGESIHALYQDFSVPAGGGFFQMVAGVDMCSVPGGACTGGTKAWANGETAAGAASATGSLWVDKGGFPDCLPLGKGAVPKGIPGDDDDDDDCVYIDFTDPAADVLDESAFLQRLGGLP